MGPAAFRQGGATSGRAEMKAPHACGVQVQADLPANNRQERKQRKAVILM